jgi:prepilin peptidase CpaA
MQAVTWWANVIVLVIASVIDLRTRRIPNWLVAPFLLAGFIVQTAMHGFPGAGRSLAGVGVAVALFGIPCFLRAMGMGDFKLAAGVGAWIGPGQFLLASVTIAIAGGVMALCYVLLRGSLAGSLDRAGDLLLLRGGPRPPMGSETAKAQSIPYAPAIAVGTLLSFFAR